MEPYHFNYIITVHNKEHLIERVLKCVLSCFGKNSAIFVVLDGCTDNTEKIVDQISSQSKIPINKIFLPDVHEILSINAALRKAPQDGKGFNIILQDDVLILEQNFEQKIINFYEAIGYSNIGLLAFRHGVNITFNNKNQELKEIDLKESAYGVGMGDRPLLPGYYIEKMVGVRSPECISTEAVRNIGYLDENLAPYTYDDHDFSIRCLLGGFRNYVLAIKFESDIKWGGMRNNPHPEVEAIMERNRKYLYKKYYDFFNSSIFLSFVNIRWAQPKRAPGFAIENQEIIQEYNKYKQKRIKLLGKKAYYKILLKRPLILLFYKFLKVLHRPITQKIFRNAKVFIKNPRGFFIICVNKVKIWLRGPITSGPEGIKGTTLVESEILKKYSKLAKIGIVEIGVLDGGTTKEMAEVATVPIYGIDPIIPDSMNKLLIGSEEKIKRNLFFYSDFHFFKDYSFNVVKNWEHEFDFIWIDGDHRYEEVKRYFTDWYPLLASGGFMAFHDSAPVTSVKTTFVGWLGPVKMVNELKNNGRLKFIEVGDSVTVFQKP